MKTFMLPTSACIPSWKRPRVWAIALFVLAGCASATKARKAFDDADADGNGHITWEEYKAAFPRDERNGFIAIDENRDDRLEIGEWEAGVGYRF
jgi:hypothetical protein